MLTVGFFVVDVRGTLVCRDDTKGSIPIFENIREAPRSDSYMSLLEMYFDWIGMMDSKLSLRELFHNTTWRKLRCPKNSAALKRMQRMHKICAYVDNCLRPKGISVSRKDGEPLSSCDNIAKHVEEIVIQLFGKEPDVFSWTRYADAMTGAKSVKYRE